MPNSNTFDIKPIHKLISKYIKLVKAGNPSAVIIDPFANRNKLANITNDLDETFDTDYHLDALDFLKMFDDNSADIWCYLIVHIVQDKYQSAIRSWERQLTIRQHKVHIGLI